MNDNLSKTTTSLFKLMKSTANANEEIRAFGAPSECLDDVYCSELTKAQEIIHTSPFVTWEHYLEALYESVSEKWIYESGIEHLVPDGELNKFWVRQQMARLASQMDFDDIAEFDLFCETHDLIGDEPSILYEEVSKQLEI